MHGRKYGSPPEWVRKGQGVWTSIRRQRLVTCHNKGTNFSSVTLVDIGTDRVHASTCCKAYQRPS
jgi:hypothetical protein